MVADQTVKYVKFLRNRMNSQAYRMVKTLRLTSISTITVKMLSIYLLAKYTLHSMAL